VEGSPTVRPPPILDSLSEVCLSLPEARREDRHGHASFTVRKKTFAYYLHDHHGDGIISVCFKMAPGGNDALVTSDGYRFYKPAYIGPRGWIGHRLDLGETDWDEVATYVTGSYKLVAPKRLVAILDASTD
jgi:predicted DNA-binding protein (MmcQ/YjbR family)